MLVVFWKQHETEDKESGEAISVPVLRYYNVFNVDQCDGLEAPDAPPPLVGSFEPVAASEAIVARYADGLRIEQAGVRAQYTQREDLVRIPNPGARAVRGPRVLLCDALS